MGKSKTSKTALTFSAGGVKSASAYGAMIACHEHHVFKNTEIVAISGNSAGSWNGSALAHGLASAEPNLALGVQKQGEVWDTVKKHGSLQTLVRHSLEPFLGNTQSGKLHPVEEMLATSAGHMIDIWASATRLNPFGIGAVRSTNDSNADRVDGILDFHAINASSIQFYSGAMEKHPDGRLEEIITKNGSHSPQTIADSSAFLSPNSRNGRVFFDGGLEKAAPIQVMEETGFQRLVAFGEGLRAGEALHPIHQSEKVRSEGLLHASALMPHHLAFLSGHKNYAITFFDFDPLEDENERMNYTSSNVDRLIEHGYSRAVWMIQEYGKDITQWPSFNSEDYSRSIEHDRAAAFG